MPQPILCLDFDGVLHAYISGWQGIDTILDAPVPGALEFLKRAVEHFDVQIFSSRSGAESGITAMRNWLREHLELAFAPQKADDILRAISVPRSKPAASLTIDDRALTFKGNWADFEPKKLLEFKPWNKQ